MVSFLSDASSVFHTESHQLNDAVLRRQSQGHALLNTRGRLPTSFEA